MKCTPFRGEKYQMGGGFRNICTNVHSSARIDHSSRHYQQPFIVASVCGIHHNHMQPTQPEAAERNRHTGSTKKIFYGGVTGAGDGGGPSGLIGPERAAADDADDLTPLLAIFGGRNPDD
jgi:hypothetical protein